MKNIFFLIMLISFSFLLFADTSGEAGFQMLKLSYGADAAALAGTGAFHTNGAYGFLQNASASAYEAKRIISVTQNLWIFDTTLNSGAYSVSNGKNSFSYAYRYLDYGKIDSYDDTGNPIGEFHPMDLVLSANFGYRFTPIHYVGVTLNGLYEKIDTASSLGYTIDLGYGFLPPIRGTILSFSLKNLGQTSEMDKEKIELPISIDLGIDHNLQFNSFDFFIEAKLTRNLDNDEFQAALGLKALYNDIFSLKIGNKFNYDAENLTFGFGIDMKGITFNYAFIPIEFEIDDAHIFELSYRFQ